MQIGDFRQVVDDDIRLVRVAHEIILVVSLGLVERLQLRYLGDNGACKRARRLKLGDVGFGHALLLVVGKEHGRAVLRARIRTLPIQFGRVIRQDAAPADKAESGAAAPLDCDQALARLMLIIYFNNNP